MNTLDDLTLVRQFVNRDSTPVTSQNFRLESAAEVTHLLSKKGDLLARLDPLTQPPRLMVKSGTRYWALLHQILSEHGFMLADQTARSLQNLPTACGFVVYESQQIPVGYQLHCTPANALWKVWLAQARPQHRLDMRLEMLLFTRNAWFPIQEISGDRDSVLIKTLITSTSLQASDYVSWLQKTKAADLSKPANRRLLPSALTVIRAIIGALWTTH